MLQKEKKKDGDKEIIATYRSYYYRRAILVAAVDLFIHVLEYFDVTMDTWQFVNARRF